MEKKVCNENLLDCENRKEHFIMDALFYDGKGSETPVSLLPLLFMYLYSRNQLHLVRNIKEFYKEYDVLLFVDYSVVIQDFDFEKFSFSHAELEDMANGTRDKALIFTVDEGDPIYETIVFIAQLKNQFLETEKKPFKDYWRGFDFYDLLLEVTPEFIKENYRYLFVEIIKRNKFLHKTYMYNSILKTQESHFELSKLMVQLLDIKEGVVVQPYADFGYTLNALPQKISYSATFEDPLAMHLVRLFGEGLIVESVEAKLDSIPKELPEYEFDYLLWNPLFHMKKDNSEYERTLQLIIERAPRKFKAACLIHDSFWLKRTSALEYCLLKYVYKIIFFRNSLTLALFDYETRMRKRKIIIVDETAALSISADDVKKHINEGKLQYVMYDRELRINHFSLDLNEIVRRHHIIKEVKGKRTIRLNSFLKEQNLKKIVFWKTKDQGGIDCKSGRDFYTSYMPFVSAENSQPLSDELFFEMKKNNAMALEVEKRMLLVNLSDRYRFQPRIFDDSKGKALLYFNRSDRIAAFEVDESIVDMEYLVCEMNKMYFKEQLFPTRACYRNDVDDFLSLYIQIPDCNTSVERQKNLYRVEKLEYIKSLTKTLGYDIEKMVANKERAFLPNGTLLLNGKYRIDSFLRHGGFGKTYKATEFIQMDGKIRKMEVVIKEFFIDKLQRRNAGSLFVETPCEKIEMVNKAQKKFMTEAEKIKQFSEHPHIVDVYDVFDENGTCYYTMEYIEGGSLMDYVEQTETCSLQEEEALEIIREVASALSEMHKHRMNHLDVKPDNILMSEEGKAVLIDFGTAHKFSESDDESSLLAITSGGFSPLEIGRIEDFSPATDIYSLGATLYWLLTGEQPPREGLTERDGKLGWISDKTWLALCEALQTYRENRPQSIDEFLAMFD